MGNRFEIVSVEELKKEFHLEKTNQYDSGIRTVSVFVRILRDKLTGMMYLETSCGLTPLLDKDGKPITTTYQVNI